MLCLAGGAVKVMLALTGFTLVWQHSVQKTTWQENYRIEGRQLVLEQAAVQGSGAGMEIGPDAVFERGYWRWQPRQTMTELLLARSEFAEDYAICWQGHCQTLAAIVPLQDGSIRVWACGPTEPP
jgi:hypothetical protein